MRVIRTPIEESFKLERTRQILELLEHPEAAVPCIHVAGTKGKGSTVAMLASSLRGCGLTVGTFTSPHLVDVRERICVNGENIPGDAFSSCVRRSAEAAEKAKIKDPHFFEILTAAAFVYFAEQAVDLAVIEVGLGGRLDSTNVITPEVCLITQISLDHMGILGRTLPEIAREKAGIMKPGIPAICAPQPDDVEAVIREVAAAVGAELKFLGKEIEFTSRFESTGHDRKHTRIGVSTGVLVDLEHVEVPLQGEHQAYNCGLAMAAIDELQRRGHHLDINRAIDGLAETRLAGRMELVARQPRILVDGAHNGASVTALVRSIGAHLQPDSLIVIFGTSVDKDIPGMIEALNMGADKVIFTKVRNNLRAAEPEDLQRTYTEITGKTALIADKLDAAFETARAIVTREDLICVTGSFYLVGETKQWIEKRRQANESGGRPSVTVQSQSTRVKRSK